MSRPIPCRTRLLVSVRDAGEAALAHEAGADIVDAKDPARGALGALPAAVVGAIVARLGAGATTSAVAGDAESGLGRLDDLLDDLTGIAATGVAYVKLAISPSPDLDRLRRVGALLPGRLIGVVFAEDGIGTDLPGSLAAAGFVGAMIDTRGKSGRRLADLAPADRLAAFVAACRQNGLISGLAGSLRVEDIPALTAHAPDYLGFRGGLCVAGDRRNALDAGRVRAAAVALRALGRRDAA